MRARTAYSHDSYVYLRDASMCGRNTAQRGVCFVLLSWAAKTLRKVASFVQVAQLELFQQMDVTK